mgnify:CR=1 FL=1
MLDSGVSWAAACISGRPVREASRAESESGGRGASSSSVPCELSGDGEFESRIGGMGGEGGAGAGEDTAGLLAGGFLAGGWETGSGASWKIWPGCENDRVGGVVVLDGDFGVDGGGGYLNCSTGGSYCGFGGGNVGGGAREEGEGEGFDFCTTTGRIGGAEGCALVAMRGGNDCT